MTALALEYAEGGTFETRHRHPGGGNILATVGQDLEIICLHSWWVANCESC